MALSVEQDVYQEIEKKIGDKLSDREKLLMMLYFDLMQTKLNQLRLEINTDKSIDSLSEKIDELEDTFYNLMENYTYEEVSNWAEYKVPYIFELLRQENEIADMYRGLQN